MLSLGILGSTLLRCTPCQPEPLTPNRSPNPSPNPNPNPNPIQVQEAMGLPYAQPQAMPYAMPTPAVHPNAHPMAVPLVAGQCQPAYMEPTYAPSASHVPMGLPVAGASDEAPPPGVGVGVGAEKGAQPAKGSPNNFCSGCGARNANPNPNQHAGPNPYQHANPDKHANPNPARCAECWRCLLLTVRRSRDLTCELYGFTPTFAHSAALSWAEA